MPEVRLDTTDAIELAEMLQFLSQWLTCDPAHLGASLEEFVGNPAYGIGRLRDDLERFVFLLAAATASPCSASRRNELPGSRGSRGYAGPSRRQRRSSSLRAVRP